LEIAIITLLAGILAAIIGGWYVVHSTKKQINAQFELEKQREDRQRSREERSILYAIKNESEGNLELLKEPYKQFHPLALADAEWDRARSRLHFVDEKLVADIRSVYRRINLIRAADSSIRGVTSISQSMPEYIQIEKHWKQLSEEIPPIIKNLEELLTPDLKN